MILSDFILSSRANQRLKYSGLDNTAECFDPEYFKSFQYPIEYVYNSRGYRDKEWPNDLTNVIWCLGDSFTVGLGSPVTHTWPYLLEQTLGQRTVNVSLDGASNDWIARKALRLFQTVAPKIIIIQWSHLIRREHPDRNDSWADEDCRLSHLPNELDFVAGLLNFQQCVQQVEKNKGNCLVLHSIIPRCIHFPNFNYVQQNWANIAGPDWPACVPDKLTDIPDFVVEELKQHGAWELVSEYCQSLDIINDTLKNICYLGMISQIDRARDGYHYDVKTAKAFVDTICQKLEHW